MENSNTITPSVQVSPIKGYRNLSVEEIALINEGKDLAVLCGVFIEKLQAVPGLDTLCIQQGKINLQQGFMWTLRGIARPTTF